MDGLSLNLIAAAAALALTHTVLGPDHTLPFIMLAQAQRWTVRRTLEVTLACSIGHVGSSLFLGAVGLALGYGVTHVTAAEEVRGGLAAWALAAFGGAYALWGIGHGLRRRHGLTPHEHQRQVHVHPGGDIRHHHESTGGSRSTFWALFLVFVLGPCEPLIPIFVVPASRGRWDAALAAALVFSVVTVATMLTLVGLAQAGCGVSR